MNKDDAETALQERLDKIRATRGDAVPLDDVAEVVRAILSTMSGELNSNELQIYNELEKLALIIRETKQEIANIRPDEIKDEFLPTASDELDAIVQSTEVAANTILDAVEEIEGIVEKVDPVYAEILNNVTMQIYEGCNFQDLTGQRINKVVVTLKRVEERINSLVNAFDAEIKEALENDTVSRPSIHDDQREDPDLLNGPQHPGKAASQDEIDALLASL